MAYLTTPNVKISGIISCVPKTVQLVKDCGCVTTEEAEKLSATTGIFERRIASVDCCTSDLCYQAAEKLIADLKWNKQEIDALIFVTQTPDYALPATSPILQNRLGLSDSCFTQDISLGCSGYVYGLVTLAKLMSNGDIKKALLLVGDTVSKICSPQDKSTYPLFGDAGTATALEFDPEAPAIKANMKSNGAGFKSIIVQDGGARNPVSSRSLHQNEISAGISRQANQLVLEGMDVFSFGITKAPEVINELLQSFSLSDADIDYYVFHQANLFMNEKIRKKLRVPSEKVPYTLNKFGNTSSATIPLTICVELKKEINKKNVNLLLCGFGVGLSWGAVYISLNTLDCIDCIEYD